MLSSSTATLTARSACNCINWQLDPVLSPGVGWKVCSDKGSTARNRFPGGFAEQLQEHRDGRCRRKRKGLVVCLRARAVSVTN